MEIISLFLLLVIFFISFTICTLFYVFKTKPTKQKLELPPGSTGWPFIGETLDYISMAKKNRIERFITERQEKYSSKIFKTSYAGEKMVFMCSPEANKFMFANDKLIKPWWPRNIGKIFEHPDNLSDYSSKEELSSIRKNVSTLFNQLDAMGKNVGLIDSIAKHHLLMHWNCQEVVAYLLAKKYTLTISLQLMLNVQDSETVEELEKLFNCIMSGMFALPINIPGTKFNRAMKASKGIRKKIEEIVRQKKIEILENGSKFCPATKASKDLLSLLIQERSNNNEEVIESDIANTILVYIVAAYDSTSTTIASIIKYLAELPQVYEQVRKEQLKIASSKRPEEPLNLEDIKKMSYSWNVVREVLRLQPTIAGPFREAITDFSFDGFLIPKGWKLHRAVHGTHKSAKYFPEPDKFDPSRFEGNKLVPYSYVPFGGGAHICPGREYARLQILVFMHYLVTKFRWEKMIPDEQMIRDPILLPAKRLPIRLYPHEKLSYH